MKKATAKDIDDAATIALIVGGCDSLPYGHPQYSDAGMVCMGRLHACEHCQHEDHAKRGCSDDEHYGPWACVAEAIGATPNALVLYHAMSTALSIDCDDEIDLAIENPKYLREWLLWLRDIGSPVRRGDTGAWQPDNYELEAGALLLDGVLPPRWCRST